MLAQSDKDIRAAAKEMERRNDVYYQHMMQATQCRSQQQSQEEEFQGLMCQNRHVQVKDNSMATKKTKAWY